MEKFKNKYRIPSARAAWWNYGWAGAYFITICTKKRRHYFGEIITVKPTDSLLGRKSVETRHALSLQPNQPKQSKPQSKKMQLSHVGVIADVLWYEIPHHAKHIELGGFVVMPNHIHGILILFFNNDEIRDGEQIPPKSPQRTELSFAQQRFQNQGKNTISSIVGSYKSAVTKHAHRLGFEFNWQSRFHDHIIRNDAEYQRINDYIETNPEHWDDDKFFK